MLKKLISMATATLVLAGGLSVVAAPSASASAPTYDVNCAALQAGGVLYLPMNSSDTRTVTFSPECVQIIPDTSNSGISFATASDSQAGVGPGWVTAATPSTAWSAIASGTPVSANNSALGVTMVTLNAISLTSAYVVFITPALISNATLGGVTLFGGLSLSPTFASGTTSYTLNTTSSNVNFSLTAGVKQVGPSKFRNSSVAATCDGTSISMTGSSGNYGGSCTVSSGTKNLVVTVTALDGTTTETYTIAVTNTSQQQNNQNNQQQQMPTNPCAQNPLSSSSTVKGVTITPGLGATAPNSPLEGVTSLVNTPSLRGSVTITAAQAASGITSSFSGGNGAAIVWRILNGASAVAAWNGIQGVSFTSSTPATLSDGDVIIINVSTSACAAHASWITVNVGSGQQQNNNSTPSVNSAAIAEAAAKAAAAVVVAKTALVETLKAGKPITAADLNAADLNIASSKAAERVAAKVLALPEVLRTDLAKVEAIVKTENFVEKVSTPATQISVTTRDLVIHELLTSDYKYKTSVVKAILAKDAADLDSIEKIQAVVKAQLAAIDARKARIAAVQARVLTYSQK